MSELKLIDAWKTHVANLSEASKLHAEAMKLYKEEDGNTREYRYRAEAEKLEYKSVELMHESIFAWSNTVKSVHGDVSVQFKKRPDLIGHDCILGNGHTYTMEMGKEQEVV